MGMPAGEGEQNVLEGYPKKVLRMREKRRVGGCGYSRQRKKSEKGKQAHLLTNDR